MPPLVGQAISAREFERESSSWTPERFTSMCNLLVWVSSGRAEIPTMTERVNVSDGGIDAEVTIREDVSMISGPILGAGWNVLQYKLREIGAQDRRNIVSNLRTKRTELRGAIYEI